MHLCKLYKNCAVDKFTERSTMADTVIIAIFIGLLLDFTMVFEVRAEKGPEQLLAEYLLSNYSSFGRPVKDPQKAVNVSIQLYFTELISMDEVTQAMTMYGYTEAVWIDENLHWDPSEWFNISRISVKASNIWLPDFRLDNSLEFDEMSLKYNMARINCNGKIHWTPGRAYTVMCNMDTTLFPFDIQTCKFEFENWMFPDTEVFLSPMTDALDIRFLRPNNEWDMKAGPAVLSSVYYSRAYNQVSYKIYLKRKPRYYILTVMLPCTVIVLSSLLVFFIPPQSGEKISFGMSVLVAFTVFLILVGSELPESSEHTPHIFIILLMVMCTISMTLVSSTIVIRLNYEKTRPVPRWMRNLILCKMAMILGMKSNQKSNTSQRTKRVSKSGNRKITMESLVESSTINSISKYRDASIWLPEKDIKESFSRGNCSAELDKNEWLKCAKIVEKFFLVIWVVMIFGCFVFSLYGRIENMSKWESL